MWSKDNFQSRQTAVLIQHILISSSSHTVTLFDYVLFALYPCTKWLVHVTYKLKLKLTLATKHQLHLKKLGWVWEKIGGLWLGWGIKIASLC